MGRANIIPKLAQPYSGFILAQCSGIVDRDTVVARSARLGYNLNKTLTLRQAIELIVGEKKAATITSVRERLQIAKLERQQKIDEGTYIDYQDALRQARESLMPFFDDLRELAKRKGFEKELQAMVRKCQ